MTATNVLPLPARRLSALAVTAGQVTAILRPTAVTGTLLVSRTSSRPMLPSLALSDSPRAQRNNHGAVPLSTTCGTSRWMSAQDARRRPGTIVSVGPPESSPPPASALTA